jgi:hypothetical protein
MELVNITIISKRSTAQLSPTVLCSQEGAALERRLQNLQSAFVLACREILSKMRAVMTLIVFEKIKLVQDVVQCFNSVNTVMKCGSIKGTEFVDQLRNCKLLKKSSAHCS